MRDRSPAVAALCLFVSGLLAVTGGCDRREGAAGGDFQAALTLMDKANQGYIAPDAEAPAGDETLSLQQYRQQTLDKALARLEQVVQSGDAAQKSAAHRMLADIHVSAARYKARQSASAYAALAAETSSLITQLRAIDRLDSQAALFSQDRSSIKDAIEAELQAQQAQRQDVAARITELNQQIEQAETQRAAARKKAEAASGEQHELESDAFVAEGDEHYNLLDRASEAKRRAGAAAAEANKHQVQIDQLQSQREIEQVKRQQIDQSIEQLEAQLRTYEQQQQTRSAEAENARQQRANAATQLVNAVEQMHQRFQQQVSQPAGTAADRAATAVEQMQKAVDTAGAAERDSARRQLLNKRVTQVRLLTDHATFLGGFGGTVSILTSRAPDIIPDQADAIQSVRREVANQQQQVIASAQR